MPSLLFLKVETNGLPKKNATHVTQDNLQDWPQVICIRAYIGNYISSDQSVSITQFNQYIINHDDIQYDQQACDIHKFTPEMCADKGISPRRALKRLNKLLQNEENGYMIGHNMSFNMNVLLAEMLRHDISIEPLLDMPQVDIMTYSTLNIRSLSNIYHYFYKQSFPHEKSIVAIILCFSKLHSMNRAQKQPVSC